MNSEHKARDFHGPNCSHRTARVRDGNPLSMESKPVKWFQEGVLSGQTSSPIPGSTPCWTLKLQTLTGASRSCSPRKGKWRMNQRETHQTEIHIVFQNRQAEQPARP